MAARGPRRTSSIKASVGKRLRALREERGLSATALANLAGTSTTEILLVEKAERTPNVVSLDHLARALRVPVTAFFEAGAKVNPPSRDDRAFRSFIEFARGRSPEYLRAALAMLRALDRALVEAPEARSR
jgi:transcriptional regulator with XRE-family HTH domain